MTIGLIGALIASIGILAKIFHEEIHDWICSLIRPRPDMPSQTDFDIPLAKVWRDEARRINKRTETERAAARKLANRQRKQEQRRIARETKRRQRAARHFIKGLHQYQSGNHLKALKQWEISCDYNDNVSIHHALAVVQLDLKHYKESLDECSIAEKMLVEQSLMLDVELIKQRGSIYLQLGCPQEALKAYSEAEQQQQEQHLPLDPEIARGRGVAHALLGHFSKALEELETAELIRIQQHMPLDPDVAKYRGVVYIMQGCPDDALIAFSEADRIRLVQDLPPDPDLAAVRQTIFGELPFLEDSLEPYYAAQQLRRNRGQAPDKYSDAVWWALYGRLGPLEIVQDALQDALRVRQGQGLLPNPVITISHAMIHIYSDDRSEACRILREAEQAFIEHGLPVPIEIETLLYKYCERRGPTERRAPQDYTRSIEVGDDDIIIL